jgi:hypothetical protein
MATRIDSGLTPGTSTTTSTPVVVSKTSSEGRHSEFNAATPGYFPVEFCQQAPGILG